MNDFRIQQTIYSIKKITTTDYLYLGAVMIFIETNQTFLICYQLN